MLPPGTIKEACTSVGVAKHGRPIGLDEKIKVDVIVIGSVAVDPKTVPAGTKSLKAVDEKGYSIVSIDCKDRPRLMFDTVCTLTDMQYVIFHASISSHEAYAFQEYFIRHIDGYALNHSKREGKSP
ncbi:hypothetical protein Ahy_B02g061174 [Arachis hypogaea]|uniref:ACT domain-containing protein ACR n=1 Tax=Arachis hypogaea TaxID=3818 RepID=A0A445AKF4_ARAHY|nr:hypothetical protein Ahy_B02g061174 [Arachis hypogaea]